MTAPLRVSFEVACPPEHAFDLWTSRIDAWWPADHTVSGESETRVVLECQPGGRIYERTAAGVVHDWGEVTLWNPPDHLAYQWHLGGSRDQSTLVEVHFLASGTGSTRIEIEHSGWDRLGASGPTWRDRNQSGWDTLLPHFIRAIEQGGP